MIAFRMAVLVVRFVVELAMLWALAWSGARLGEGSTAWLLGISLPLATVFVWQLFVAPKARRPVPIGVRIAIELVLFGLTTALLSAANRGGWAIVFALAAVATTVANAATHGVRTSWDEQLRPS